MSVKISDLTEASSITSNDYLVLDNSSLTQKYKIINLQFTGNLVTALTSSSTDTQYPSAKCVYDIIGNIETLLGAI